MTVLREINSVISIIVLWRIDPLRKKNDYDADNTMLVRKFYSREDPWNELFRSFMTFDYVLDVMYRFPNTLSESLLSSDFDSEPFFQIPNLDNLISHLHLTCTPSVKEGKWYRIKWGLALLLIAERCTVLIQTMRTFLNGFLPLLLRHLQV